MDRQAIAEDVVGLWDMVKDAWLKTHDSMPKMEVHIALFERAHSYVIHQNIGAEHKAKKEEHKDPEDKEHCNQCGRKLTDKEQKFLDDQPSKPRICYHCTKGL